MAQQGPEGINHGSLRNMIFGFSDGNRGFIGILIEYFLI